MRGLIALSILAGLIGINISMISEITKPGVVLQAPSDDDRQSVVSAVLNGRRYNGEVHTIARDTVLLGVQK